MNVSDMVANGLKRCVWILRTCLPMYIVAVANEIERCVCILRTCLQMHNCIPLNSYPPEQI